MAGPKTSIPSTGWRKSLPKNSRITNVANAIRQLRDQAQGGSNNGGGGSNNGGGGGGGAAVSTLAGLPQTPELAALIKSGMIREGMAPEQALAIMAASKLGTQVPIDIAALKAMVAGDYATSTNGVTGPAQQWMQQLMGANAPQPGDPMYAEYMADPIFSEYAGGLQQMEETAETNQATDQAWFDKQQQAMTDYYNGLMASIGSAAPAGGGGGGGGGGGRRHGGGGGGGSGGGGDWGDVPNPYEFSDPKTKATSQERITDTSTSITDEMAPDYWQNLLTEGAVAASEAGMSPEEQAIFNEYINTASTKYHGDPNEIMSQATTDWEDMLAQDEIQQSIQTGNETFDANAPVNLNAQLSNYLMSNNLELGDDPAQAGLQTFRPILDPETGKPITNPNTDPAMMVANQQAQQFIQDKLNSIYAASTAPGAGQAFDPSAAALNKIFNYVSSDWNQNGETMGPAIPGMDYGGGKTDFGTPGTNQTVAAASPPAGPPASVGDLVAQQTGNAVDPGKVTGNGFNPTAAVDPGNIKMGTDIGNTVASQMPQATQENQIIWDGSLPVANVGPDGQPPADESDGLVWDGSTLVPAATAAANNPQPKSWWQTALAQAVGQPQGPPDLTNIKNVIASQFPPSTATIPQGSVAGDPGNPMLANGSQPPTMTPTGIPLGTESGPSGPTFGQRDPWSGGWQIPKDIANGGFVRNQPTSPVAPASTDDGFVRNGGVPQAGIPGGEQQFVTAANGGRPTGPAPMPQPPISMEQQMQEGFGNPSPYPPGEQWRAQLNQANPRPNAEANIQAIVDQLYNKVRNPQTTGGPVGNDPYVAPAPGTVDWASGGTPTTTVPPTMPFGSSRMMPDSAMLGAMPGQIPMGNKTLPTAPPAPSPVPQPDPAMLQQIAQAVINNGGIANPATINRAPATAQSMIANLNLQGTPFAPASTELLQNTYGGPNSGALDAAYQAWLNSTPEGASGPAVGAVAPEGVFNDWQNSRFNPKTGMVSEQVMNILRGGSVGEFMHNNPGVDDLEKALALQGPGKIWQTPETPEQAAARQVQEAANRWLIAPSREASTWWHPAVYKNRDQTQVMEQDTINSSATSRLPEATYGTNLPELIQDPNITAAPEDTLDYEEQPIFDPEQNLDLGMGGRGRSRSLGLDMLTKAPKLADNIMAGGGKKTGGGGMNKASGQSAVKRAAKNRLQAKVTFGGKKTNMKLGGKY